MHYRTSSRGIALFGTIGLSCVLLAGCQTTTTSPGAGGSGATRSPARSDVMDFDDSPAAPIPPANPAATPPRQATDAAPAPSAPAQPRTHTVQAKDTLYKLAQQYYGDAKQWPLIVEANPGLVPERMPVGKAIVIP